MSLDLEPTPSTLVQSLPGSAYLDPAVFDAERRAIWRRGWQCVGRADLLARPGSFLRVDLDGESVLVVRDAGDALHAMRNLCRHRGARICLEDRGGFGRAITCPYHGWSYGLDGHLIAAPNMPELPDLVKEQLGLHPVRLTEWLGYIWLTLDGEAAPLATQVERQIIERLGTTATLERYQIERLVPARTVVYEVDSNWKCIVENFMECYHCAAIHPELTAALPQFASGYGTISGGVGAGATFADGISGFSIDGRAHRPVLPGLLPQDDQIFHGILLLPGVFLVLVPDHVALYRLTPTAVGHTRVSVDWLFDVGAVAAADFDPGPAVEILDITNRQDFDACRRVQLGMASDAYRGVLVPAEHVVTAFHDWWRAGLETLEPAGPRSAP